MGVSELRSEFHNPKGTHTFRVAPQHPACWLANHSSPEVIVTSLMRALLTVGLFAAALPGHLAGQATTRIEVVSQAEGTAGEQLVFQVKERIRQSSGLRLADTGPRIQMIINTLPRDRENPDLSTVYGVVWVWTPGSSGRQEYFESTLGYAGRNRLDESAADLVAQTDQVADSVRRWLRGS